MKWYFIEIYGNIFLQNIFCKSKLKIFEKNIKVFKINKKIIITKLVEIYH